MMLEWYRVGMKGQKPDIPAKGYTWKTLPELNRKIQVENENLLLEEAIDLVRDSHKKIHKIMNQHTNEELFEKNDTIGQAAPPWELILSPILQVITTGHQN